MADPGRRGDGETLLSMPVYAPGATFNDTTRQLCAAPYLDPGFGNAVISEVLEAERKAVPPSYGFDLDPVVRHCLRARRLLLGRYAAVTVLLLAGLWVNAPVTLGWLALCAVVVGARSPAVRGLPRPVRLGALVAVAGAGICLVGYLLLSFILSGLLDSSGYAVASGYAMQQYPSVDFDEPAAGLGAVLAGSGRTMLVLAPVGLAAAMFLALFLSRRHAYGVLTTELAPGIAPVAPRSSNPRVEWRLGVVAAMQRGNICVQDVNPFAGAGWPEHSWSFATRLRSRADGGHTAIDSVALNQRVHAAILDLRGEHLRDSECIPNVYVFPYVAADGYRRGDDPLIDPRTGTPRTKASSETISAIMGSPQGGLRHYLRAVVPANGKEIRTPDGRLVLPAQDSGIGVTAFVHLAVEGGMLYTEFVCTVMPQVRPLYQLVDNLRPDRVAAQAAWDTLGSFMSENLLGAGYLVRLGWDTVRLPGRMARSARLADKHRYYDYGAHFSVRELAALYPTVKFMQVLDAEKYIKLLDRAVSETVLDYLDEKGVDTTELRNAVSTVSIGNMTVHGGQQNFGGTNTNVQHNRATPPKPRSAAR